MKDIGYYIGHLEVLVERARAEGLETLAFLLQMPLDHTRDVRDGRFVDGKIPRNAGKKPYSAPDLKILYKRNRKAA